ncbi:GNAT family N-acetyltransferase [Paenibacillus sp. H1-7]|uniref:GNAT family N-acetyltransferase n=1 Tax=Paenibacillus sp. H1-7 TaxID=2282849 RepID=UPI001EF7C8E7|nr:GNAT family N-acetyltransferase [Paenibacillus sp. H1-7]ULL18595.1 GNAT family N-acetyltransferase [Paenibacillus sp. H1-7]
MNIEVTLTREDEAYIIKNLYPLYLYDLSEHYGLVPGHTPNGHGIYESSDEYRTLQDQYEVQSIWWEKPNCLYPFLIRVDGIPAGFALIATPPYCSKGIDYFVNEFFLLRPFRGKGIAEKAAAQIFTQFKGSWELFTNPAGANGRGQAFWRKALSSYTNGKYEETHGSTFNGDMVIFRFRN